MAREAIATSSATRLEWQLSNMLTEGRLAAGERLPSVRELTRQFGISRNSVQAAIRGLAAQGLVRSLPRQGTIVLPRDDAAKPQSTRAGRQIGIIDILSSLRFDDKDTELWFQGAMRGAEHALSRANYDLVKTVLPQETRWARKVFERIDDIKGGMAGVMLHADIATDELLSGLDARGIPWVTVGRRTFRSLHNFVAMDHLSTAHLIGWAFSRLGYKTVLYLGWDIDAYFRSTGVPLKPDEKFLGLVQGYLDGGGDLASVKLVRCSEQTVDMGYQKTRQFLNDHGAPQGVFSFNDHLSLGAMRALQDGGIKVPDEAGVVGSMGMAASQYSDPPLAVATQPISEMGRQVAQLLLEMIRGDICRISGRFISYELALRGSLPVPDELQRELQERHASQRTLTMRTGL